MSMRLFWAYRSPLHLHRVHGEQISSRVSGPLLDRLDLHIEVPAVHFDELSSKASAESSETIKKRVDAARAIQNERLKGTGITCNAKMTPTLLQKHCQLDQSANRLLKAAFEKLGLSARAYDRVLKVARTIADLTIRTNTRTAYCGSNTVPQS